MNWTISGGGEGQLPAKKGWGPAFQYLVSSRSTVLALQLPDLLKLNTRRTISDLDSSIDLGYTTHLRNPLDTDIQLRGQGLAGSDGV
jgi:hypothetical protein